MYIIHRVFHAVGVKLCRIYSYGVGIWRCSFNFDGQCQSLYMWDE